MDEFAEKLKYLEGAKDWLRGDFANECRMKDEEAKRPKAPEMTVEAEEEIDPAMLEQILGQ